MIQYWTRSQALLQWGRVVLEKDGLSITRQDGPLKISWIQRRGKEGDIWFVANSANTAGTVLCRFAISGKQPEIWDPVTGETRALPDFTPSAAGTEVPLEFAPGQSHFIVFRNPAPPPGKVKNFPELVPIATLDGPWQVQFDKKWGGPENPVMFEKAEDWTTRAEPGIKFYSGMAIYRKTFDAVAQNGRLLDLGEVKHTARIRLNGIDLGVVWTAPWRVRIPDGLLRTQGNQLEIEVANVWANRLIGDEHEPPDCEWVPGERGFGGSLKQFPEWFLNKQPRPSKGRYCFTTWNYFTKDSPLIPSGLLRPVRLLSSTSPAPARRPAQPSSSPVQ